MQWMHTYIRAYKYTDEIPA